VSTEPGAVPDMETTVSTALGTDSGVPGSEVGFDEESCQSEIPSRGERRRVRQLRRVRRWGLLVLGAQLVVLVLWSLLQVNRFVEMPDFGGFYQAWYLIGHGVLNPGPGWWKAQAIFIMWPLALFAAIWPHPITLLVIQDLAIVGAEAVAFFWLTDIVRKRPGTPFFALSGLGLLLLVADPWIYWSASWDYHSEAVGAFFAILAARELFRGRARGWLWSGLTLLSGLIPATYLVGIGISLAFRRRFLYCLILVGAVAIWLLVMLKLGAGAGLLGSAKTSIPQSSSNPLISAVHYELGAFGHLLSYRLDIFANLAPAGLIGFFTAPVFALAAVMLTESAAATSYNSIVPSFQNLGVYVFLPVGTVLALCWLYRRFGRRLGAVLMTLVAVNALGWAIVWIPQAKAHWLRVSASEAAVLRRAQTMIGADDEVVASQGVVGDFAGRSHFFYLQGQPPLEVPIDSPTTWFIVAPYAGVETETVPQSMAIIDYLATVLRARLIFQDDGIWVFRWHLPPGQKSAVAAIPRAPTTFPAWLYRTGAGRHVLSGPVQSWRLQSDGPAGPLLYGDYWLEGVGRYQANVRFQSAGPTDVQVWDDSSGALLSNTQYAATHGIVDANTVVSVTKNDPLTPNPPYKGVWPFRTEPNPGFHGDDLEITVLVPAGVNASVYSVSLSRVAPSRADVSDRAKQRARPSG